MNEIVIALPKQDSLGSNGTNTTAIQRKGKELFLLFRPQKNFYFQIK